MRGRDTIAMSVAALAVTAAFAIVSAPLPTERPTAAGSQGGFVVLTVVGTEPGGGESPIRDCPGYSTGPSTYSPES